MDLLKWFVAFSDIKNNSEEVINSINKIRQAEHLLGKHTGGKLREGNEGSGKEAEGSAEAACTLCRDVWPLSQVLYNSWQANKFGRWTKDRPLKSKILGLIQTLPSQLFFMLICENTFSSKVKFSYPR